MKYLTIILGVTFLCSLGSCEKKCIQQKDTYTVSSEMYSYVFLDTSIFVYVNTTTNVVDTEIMYSEQQGNIPKDTSDNCVSLQEQFYNMSFYDKITGTVTKQFFDYNGISQDGTDQFPYYGVRIYDRQAVNVGDSTPYVKYIAFYNSMLIQGSNIYYVKKILLNYKSPEYPNTTYLYWAPQCGIVRREFHDSLNNVITWDLVLGKCRLKYL